jgi:uncharacterized protein YggE
MKSVSILAVVALVLTALLSACGPMTVNAEAQPPLRLINVTGTGEVSLSPDIAYIYLGVHTEDASASEAVAANNTQTQEVIEALQNFGVEANDIRTSNFSIWPAQNYGPDGLPLDTRYVVDNTVYVTVRDLDQMGELLDVVIGAGVNTVNSIQFDVAEKKDSLREARAAAIEDAQERARELAQAAGLELGDIQSISFFDSAPYPVFTGKGGGGAAEAAVPIQPGQMTLSASVSISYEIK